MAHDVPDSADRRRSSPLRRSAIRLRSPRLLVLHSGIYLLVNGFALVVWLLAPDPPTVAGVDPGLQDQFWPGWTLLVLGVPLGLHATIVLATRPSRSRSAPRPGVAAPPAPPPGADQADRTLVTVLFTDIVGSTERAREAGDRRWGALLDAHDRLARELVDRFGGRLIKSTGDGILAAFERPGRAIRCATSLCDRVREIGVELRAGLHTGEVQFRGDDVGGIAVHIAARVMATAGPGEVLVSRTVHDLVTGSDYVLEDRGAHSLRGVAGEWRLFAVRA